MFGWLKRTFLPEPYYPLRYSPAPPTPPAPPAPPSASSDGLARLPRSLRLATERTIVLQNHPGFTWSSAGNIATVEGSICTLNDRSYRVRIVTGTAYPFAHPRAYVLSKLKGKKFYEVSHAMHTQSPDESGNAQMCLYNSETWRGDLSLHHVLVKAKVWLLAYEMHLRTGKPLCDFLRSA